MSRILLPAMNIQFNLVCGLPQRILLLRTSNSYLCRQVEIRLVGWLMLGLTAL